MKREEFETSHLREALAFPFYPSALVYNIIATLIVCGAMFIFAYGQDTNSMSISNAVVSYTEAISLSPVVVFFLVCFILVMVFIVKDVVAFFMVIIFAFVAMLAFFPTAVSISVLKQQGALEHSKELKSLLNMFQNIVVNENAVEANYSAGLWVLVIGFILFLFFSMRGVDVTAQLAEEDYGRPSWGFAGYVSWSSLGKFVAVTIIALVFFLFSIWMLSLIFSMYIDEWTVITRSIFSLVVFFEFLVCIWFYPALVLTLVRTESFFKMLKFSENYKTITHYVGKKNYMIMASLMSNVTLMFLFYSLVIDVLGINLLTLGIAFFLCFFALHFFVAIHYLVGLLSGYSELQEEEEEANEYELDFDDMLDDVKICVNNGYPEDAITLLTNVIQNKTEPPKAQLTM